MTASTTTRPNRLRLTAAIAGLVLVIVALHAAARLGLRGPTGISRDEFTTWFEDPIDVATTVVRWLCLFFAYYLLAVVVVLGLTGDNTESRAGVRRFIPQGIAGAAGVLLGFGAITVPLGAHMAGTGPSPTVQVIQLREVPENDDRLHLEPVLTLDEIPVTSSGVDNHAHPLTRAQSTDSAIERVEVRRGDTFWGLAQETLADHWSRTDLSDEEIVPYWRQLIEHNQDQLVEPGNPDLIVPGQVFELPDPPPEP